MADRRVSGFHVEWPRRLLHVPTMTSIPRSGHNTYGGVQEPDYNALTYTWGRYEMPTGHRLDLEGIAWRVPCICPSHFTVTEFDFVLKSIASDSGFVWVDVACIDQEDLVVKMDEIGRQADIFRRAKKVYAWLTSHSTDQLISLTSQVDRFSRELERLEISDHSFEYGEADIQRIVNEGVGACLDAVARLISDPWFTSLWTLEEAYLRDDAVLLSRTGGIIPRGSPISNAMQLITLGSDFQTINLALAPYRATSHELECLLKRAEESGLIYIDVVKAAPMLLYSAASFRTTTRELDRIYGIMQVYDFRLGASKSPGTYYQLEELEHQLATALNLKSAPAAQLFIHVKPPPAGQAWRISQHCTMPEVYYLCRICEERCRLSFNSSGEATFNGTCNTLTSLRRFWDQAVEHRSDRYAHGASWWRHYRVNINLDSNQTDIRAYEKSFELVREAQDVCRCPFCSAKPSSQKQGLSKFIAALPSPEACYSVLMLGGVRLYKAAGPGTGVLVLSWAGLLVVGEVAPSGEIRQRRVGICSWEAAEGDLKPHHESLWKPCTYQLG